MIGITQLGDDSARGFPFHHVGDEMTQTRLPKMQRNAMQPALRFGKVALYCTPHVYTELKLQVDRQRDDNK